MNSQKFTLSLGKLMHPCAEKHEKTDPNPVLSLLLFYIRLQVATFLELVSCKVSEFMSLESCRCGSVVMLLWSVGHSDHLVKCQMVKRHLLHCIYGCGRLNSTLHIRLYYQKDLDNYIEENNLLIDFSPLYWVWKWLWWLNHSWRVFINSLITYIKTGEGRDTWHHFFQLAVFGWNTRRQRILLNILS